MDYRLVDHPEMLPGCCFISRTDVGPFIDTGIDVEDLNPVGRIYLAQSTISDFAQQLGFAPPEAWRRAKDRLDELSTALLEAEGLIDALQAANGALTAAGYTAPEAPLLPPAGSVPEVLLWVAESDDYAVVVDRAHAARDAELLEAAPRQDLLAELDMYLTMKEAST